MAALLSDFHLRRGRHAGWPGARGPVSGLRDGLQLCSCGVAVETRQGQAYNEEAFRYFLAIERQRSRRSGRAFLLLLVDLKPQPGTRAYIEPTVVSRLFSGLWRCVRETDIVGWYHDRRVAGAVLTELGPGFRPEDSDLVRQRITGVLCEFLAAHVARLRVRIYRHRELFAGENECSS